MENIENIETIDEIIEDLESFPVKDRSNAIRRKKTYFKGKRRWDRVNPIRVFAPKDEPVIRGMLRKTNVVRGFHEKNMTKFGTNPSTIRRKLSANDKLAEYSMEEN